MFCAPIFFLRISQKTFSQNVPLFLVKKKELPMEGSIMNVLAAAASADQEDSMVEYSGMA
jgi:hypothetical protein